MSKRPLALPDGRVLQEIALPSGVPLLNLPATLFNLTYPVSINLKITDAPIAEWGKEQTIATEGVVIFKETGQPIPNAPVTLQLDNEVVDEGETDSNGIFVSKQTFPLTFKGLGEHDFKFHLFGERSPIYAFPKFALWMAQVDFIVSRDRWDQFGKYLGEPTALVTVTTPFGFAVGSPHAMFGEDKTSVRCYNGPWGLTWVPHILPDGYKGTAKITTNTYKNDLGAYSICRASVLKLQDPETKKFEEIQLFNGQVWADNPLEVSWGY